MSEKHQYWIMENLLENKKPAGFTIQPVSDLIFPWGRLKDDPFSLFLAHGAQETCRYPNPLHFAVDLDLFALEIRFKATLGFVVSVTDVVPRHGG